MAKTEIKLYNANVLLKGANQNIQYSEEQLKEYLRCAEDPVYFITNYCKIVTLDHGLQPFKLYDCQIEKVNTIHNNRKVILMESRQSGKCVSSNSRINIKNKTTGEIHNVSIEEFHEMQRVPE